jgi:hypothetical protein
VMGAGAHGPTKDEKQDLVAFLRQL